MNYYIVTGASKGIGKALVENLLQTAHNRVIGISRNCTISHPHYHHQPLDMSDIAAVENNLYKIFQLFEDATKLVLVNNAGVGLFGPPRQVVPPSERPTAAQLKLKRAS